MSGMVTENDLTNLLMLLTNGGVTVYQDDTIVNSTVTQIGGVARTLSDINFNFDIDALPSGLGLFDNDIPVSQSGSATGVTYNIFTNVGPQTIGINAFNDGSIISQNSSVSVRTQTTTAVPEPSALVFLGFVGFGAVISTRDRRRQKADGASY